MYQVVGERQGVEPAALRGTVQNDVLKEFLARKTYVFPPEPSLRLVADVIEYATRHLPRFNPISVTGYHAREAGCDAVQELAFTMCNAVAYLQEVTQAGVAVDEFAPRLAFYFVAQQDFFEEIAKFRAARRCWAKIARRFGAKKPESMRLRFHCQTAAATLTKPQPMNNIVRTALQALSAVLGGCQSLHTNGLDEAYAIPSEMAMKIALRTQQIIADETRVTQVVDPLAGSWYVESLTKRIEDEVFAILDKVETMGGTVRAVEQGYFQKEIAETAYRTVRKKASGELPVIGVNKYVDPPRQEEIEIHNIDPEVEARQIARTKEVRRKRDARKFGVLMDRLEREARDPAVNLMPVTIDLVKTGATMGEIVSRLKGVFGTYVETPVF
jgi:methylmalonyl-CoA mutase N-terminal domain/subunit